MKIAEWLYCDVDPPPILPVQPYFIKLHTVTQSCSYTVVQVLLSYIHSCIYTFHAYTTCTQYPSYMIALVTQHPGWLYPFSLVNRLQNTFLIPLSQVNSLQIPLCQVNSLQIPLSQVNSL